MRKNYKDIQDWRDCRYQEEETKIEAVAMSVVMIVGIFTALLMLALLSV
ncbi:hypothetical protein [Proteiniclasticum sp.]|nr:hypothetical protein [Proteiniclasticum sp.]